MKKRRRGCLTGCLVNVLLLLGVLALLFVAACSLGVIRNDPETGAPYVTLEGIGLGNVSLPEIALPEPGTLQLPPWAFRVQPAGLTVKTLHAGDGEAVLVCSDGYTMLLGAGGGTGALLCAQLLLCGVNRLSAAVAMQCTDEQIGGMRLAIALLKPAYLLYPDTQVKGSAYNAMMTAAGRVDGLTRIAPEPGLTFSLGRATVTVVGPANRHHTDPGDDGLSVRIDYGQTSVLVTGGVSESAERELVASGVRLDCDVLIASGSEASTGLSLVQAATPSVALLTGKNPHSTVRVRLQRAGAEVYCAQEYGVMTVFSDGQRVTVQP